MLTCKRQNVADSIKNVMEFVLQNSLSKIEATLVDSLDSNDPPKREDEVVQLERYHLQKLVVKDEDLWCDRVCVHVKVEMDSTLWHKLPPTI